MDIFASMKLLFPFILIAVSLIISGCYVENASSSKNKVLVIASDYLNEEDTLMFSDFSKKESTRIIIKHIDVSSLVGEIQGNQYAHGIDLVMIKSLYNVYNLSRTGLFHSISHVKEEFEELSQFMSTDYKYIGVGIDPYICISNPDTNIVIRTYNDLKHTQFVSTLTEDELIPMLAPLMSKFNKVKSYEWVESVFKNELSLEGLDSNNVQSAPVLLTTFENYLRNFKGDSTLSTYTNLSFPNSSSSGTFYNMRTACIIGQAQHFAAATSFLNFYLLPQNNRRLNGKLKTMSVTNTDRDILLYQVNSEELMQYYLMFKRILSRLN